MPRVAITRSYRLAIAARAIAAIVGSYVAAAATAAALARMLPIAPIEAVVVGTLLSFLVIPVAAIWAFAASSVARAWIGIAAPTALLLLAAWLAGPK